MKGFDLVKLCIAFDFGETNAVAKAVLIALASFYNENNDGVWPGEKDLLPLASCERRALFRAIKWLEEVELITVERFFGKGNHYRFNEELLLKGNFQKVTGYQNVTGYQKVTAPVTKKQPQQLPKSNGTSYQNVTQTNKNKKETNKEQINQEGISISSCFSSFGQNPVSAPTRWEPDEENVYDLPVQQQAAMARKVDVDIDDHDHVLTATEMIVLAAQLGYRLTRNVVIDEVAERKTLTVKMLAEACQRTRDNSGGIGYLVRILQNASKNPDAFNGVRKVPDITAENITDKQCYLFAKKLANYHPFASKNAKYMEEESAMVERFTGRLKDKEFFEHCRPTLVKLGCLKGAAA